MKIKKRGQNKAEEPPIAKQPLDKPNPRPAEKHQSKDPLHGVKLADMVEQLQQAYGWDYLFDKIPVRCFKHDPSIKSSLHFLRRTPWARTRLEELYVRFLKKKK